MDTRNVLDASLQKKADEIRKKTVEFAVNKGGEHIAPSLSCVDILTVLYYKIMNISFRHCEEHGDEAIQKSFIPTSLRSSGQALPLAGAPRNDKDAWENRDRFILSKGHGCYSLYVILNDLGIIPNSEIENFHNGGSLKGCVEINHDYGLETSCGSLGHGLPVAVGIAFGAKLQNKDYQVYCLVGDGEMQEGSMWEAIQFAAKHELSNLTLIIDNNGLQAMDFLDNILVDKNDDTHFERKLSAFGFETVSCNGHNTDKIESAIKTLKNSTKNSPKVVIAKTIKGYGLLCMENIPKFHFRTPSQEEFNMGNRYE